MSAYPIICTAALIGSGLTLFSGFGLGTILSPVFALFFPIDIAIALTAVVHFLNNLFKLALLGKHADKRVVIRFGLPSIFAAFAGAYVLTLFTSMDALYTYSMYGKTFAIMPVKLVIALLLLFFSLMDVLPALTRISFERKYLPLGGLLSGFFGGLSGNQGALRSAFLVRANLSKEAFIASGVVIACMIDVSRLIVYSEKFLGKAASFDYRLIAAATLSAFAGVYFGSKVLKKVTIKGIQYFVAVMLMVFSLLLGAGVI